ncbi:hypothetical protein VP1G_07308 [Cytospora mali]|uniref:Carboxymuconolactone decarboxylase-like domain-containing protein n=1 Tax=Cytospora mali TaxID=578113 RepID=A0A194V8A1_CYTMA|nr:hypothetical protein VP1G_07308 [Valsa mali var. pyri (nom. inval.)]
MTDCLLTVVTPKLLDSFRSQENLPDDVWYIVVATTLCILNRPEEIQTVYEHAVARGYNDQGQNGVALADSGRLRIARRLREALLKTSAIGGLPKTINALLELKKVVPAHLSDEPDGESPTHRRQDMYDTPSSQVIERGQAFFNRCYGKVAERVRTSLDHSGTEDLGLAARLTYGYVLSPTAILTEAETSFVMIAGLIPQDVNPQLKGHLKGALNGGASIEQVRAVRQVAVDVCRAAGMRLLTGKDATGGWGWRAEVQNL